MCIVFLSRSSLAENWDLRLSSKISQKRANIIALSIMLSGATTGLFKNDDKFRLQKNPWHLTLTTFHITFCSKISNKYYYFKSNKLLSVRYRISILPPLTLADNDWTMGPLPRNLTSFLKSQKLLKNNDIVHRIVLYASHCVCCVPRANIRCSASSQVENFF